MSEYHTPGGSGRRKSIITVGSLYRSQPRSDSGQFDDAEVSEAISNVGEKIKSIDV